MFFDKKSNSIQMAPSDAAAMAKNDPQLKELMELRSRLKLHETNSFKATLCDEVVTLADSMGMNFADKSAQSLLTAFSDLVKSKNLQMESVKAVAQSAIESSAAMSEILAPGNAELSDVDNSESRVDVRHQALVEELSKITGGA